MELLTGEYRNTLDEKGRILFPAKLRAGITGNSLYITHAMDCCLWLFTADEWEKFLSKIMETASPFNANSRSVIRRLVAPAQEIEFDRSGRLSVPQSLREYASLSKDCVILGINKYIELWDAEKYQEYLAETESSFLAATEELKDICF